MEKFALVVGYATISIITFGFLLLCGMIIWGEVEDMITVFRERRKNQRKQNSHGKQDN